MSPEGHPPVTLAVVGAGVRATTAYTGWVAAHPERAKIVAVAEPRDFRRKSLAEQHGIPDENVFSDWRELVAAGRLADAAIITTPDSDHVEPAKALAAQGYDLMLEKPMAPTEEECRELTAATVDAGVLLAVCHVLRYTPYTRALKKIIDAGKIGDVMSVQHLEPVGFWHQAHSFVRGNWRRTDESSFMLLAKSCHDIDWLRHIVGQPIQRVSSFGRLSHFRRSNQPEGAADRCVDCGVEHECPYSAKRLYLGQVRRGATWPVVAITNDLTETGVMRALKEGPYGRCVYACDNDVVDHQVVSLEFGSGITGTFTMTAFTDVSHRETQVFGTRGRLDGNGDRITVFDFLTGEHEVHELESSGADAESGHGGGDGALMDAFASAVATGDRRHILSGPMESLETHLAVFAAERARLQGTVETVPTLSR